jgi:hypothetical protein
LDDFFKNQIMEDMIKIWFKPKMKV